MSTPQIALFGSWHSPLTPEQIYAQAIALGQIALDGDDIYWLEGRPTDGGRVALVRRAANGTIADVTPPGAYVRTRVHEYGGGAYLVAGGTVYYVEYTTQRLMRLAPGSAPEALTPDAALRFADLILDRPRRRLIAVCEDHTNGEQQVVNRLVAIPLDGSPQTLVTLAEGHDFFASPRLSPDGTHLAWQAWDFPNMPWDGNTLWLAPVNADGTLGAPQAIAGGTDESIFQPQWSPDGTLYFISDRTNWWNLYRWQGGQVVPVFPLAADFGLPQWQFAQSTYAFESPTRIIAWYTDRGAEQLVALDLAAGTHAPLQTPFTIFHDVQAAPGRVVTIGGGPDRSGAVIMLDFAAASVTTLRQATDATVPAGYLSVAQPVEFPTDGGKTAFGYFYPPANREYQGPAGAQPPLLVMSHGGPTAATSPALSLSKQYWTSRGFAILDVNYGGSTGYGREYRNRLRRNWGIVDVRDCANGARWLAQQGLVDGARLAIDGGSAGGYTTLAALAFTDVFRAGASYFGVSDPELLAKETHKFESRYCDMLIAPYPAERAVYDERSPLQHADRIHCPVIFFQGLDDPIVLPNQSEKMVQALRARGIPVAYLAFPGESHGFRKAENLKRSLEAEFAFYARIFGFTPADVIEPVPIANL